MALTYADPLSNGELMQGDIIRRTDDIDRILNEVHPHFSKPKYIYFVVLTQSCDLVRRDEKPCKAPYITIAPVRNLEFVVDRHLANLDSQYATSSPPILAANLKTKLVEFLTRLFNNNEPGYFFFDSQDGPLTQDCVAILTLSIAIKSDLHYQSCLNAKISQLHDTFQAKLGWLIGQLYSRVGTPDMIEASLRKKVAEATKDLAIWVEDKRLGDLKTRLNEYKNENPGIAIDQEIVRSLLRAIPTRKQNVIERIRAIVDQLNIDEGLSKRIVRRIESDAAITKLLNN